MLKFQKKTFQSFTISKLQLLEIKITKTSKTKQKQTTSCHISYYTLYRMDPKKHTRNIFVSLTCQKSKNERTKNVYIPPPLTPDQPPLKGGRYV